MSKYKDDYESLSYSDLADLGFGLGPFIFLIEYFGLFNFILMFGILTSFLTYILKTFLFDLDFYSVLYNTFYNYPSIAKSIVLIIAFGVSFISTFIILWIFGTIVFHKIKTGSSWLGLFLRIVLGIGGFILILCLSTIGIWYSIIGFVLLLLIHYSLQAYCGNTIAEEVSSKTDLVDYQKCNQIKKYSLESGLLNETVLGGNYTAKVTDYLIDRIEKKVELGETELKKGSQEARYIGLQYKLNMFLHTIDNLKYDKLLATQEKVNALKNASLEADRLENMIQCERLINERNKAHLLTEIAHYKALITELLTLAGNMQMRNSNRGYSDFEF